MLMARQYKGRTSGDAQLESRTVCYSPSSTRRESLEVAALAWAAKNRVDPIGGTRFGAILFANPCGEPRHNRVKTIISEHLFNMNRHSRMRELNPLCPSTFL